MTDWTKIVRAVADPRGKRPDSAIIAMIAEHADEQFARYGITTLRRQACILTHACVETANFSTLEENLNYSAERLHDVWPKRFPTVASAAPYAHNPRALANKVYNGRLGNRPGSDDGWLNRGKGLWQNTGREHVERLAKKLGVSVDVASAWLVHPDHALECACALFDLLGVRAAADAGDIDAETRRINGGTNGLVERKAARPRAIRALSAEAARARVAAIDAAPDVASDPIPAQAVIADLRAAGSRTIAGADATKQGLAGSLGSVAAATVAASQVQDVSGRMREAVVAVQSGVGALETLRAHWPLLAIVALAGVAAVFAWRAWRGASLVTAARVDDAVSGLNIGR